MPPTAQPAAEMAKIRALLTRPEPAKWVFGGDSITHGALHTFGLRDYTEHFCERVRWELGRRRDCVIKTAISGWTVTQLLEDIEWSLMQHKPQAVSLMFGANDCVGGPGKLGEFKRNYIEVIRRARGELGAAIVVHTPTWVMPPDAERAAQLPAFVEAVRGVAAECNAVLVDHWSIWKDHPSTWYWLSDPVHPNELGHRAIAHLMFRELGLWDETSAVCRLMVP